jgi:hypothetical protein
MTDHGEQQARVWQQEALVNQIESTALWRGQRNADHPEKARNDRAAEALHELAAHVARLPGDHRLFAALLASANDIGISELVSERLWRYGFADEEEPASFTERLAEEVDQARAG